MKRGDQVQQIMPAPFTGAITGFQIDQETGDKLVHVVAEDGSARYFKESEVAVVAVGDPDGNGSTQG